LARSEYFKFTIEIIKNYKLVKNEGKLKPAHHGALLMPDPMKIKFIPRV